MRIVLHVGFHKTGTTSLQAALAAHRDALAPVAHVETRRLSPALVPALDAARRFSRLPDAARQRRLGRALADWVAALPDLAGRDLLISSEDFAGHMPGRHGLVDYRAAQVTVPLAVRALTARFAGAAVAVLVTTRAAGPWLQSLHWQLAQHPDLTLTQAEFCRAFAAAADFEAVLGPLAVALRGRAHLHRAALEDIAPRRLGPVEAVHDLAGLPAALRAGLAPVAPRNRRVAEGLADQFVALNRAGLPVEELARAKSMMQGLMAEIEAEDGPSPLSAAPPTR